MKSSEHYEKLEQNYKRAMLNMKRNRWPCLSRWNKDVVYDIIGTLLVGAVILAMMML
jgi:hypothetical protein